MSRHTILILAICAALSFSLGGRAANGSVPETDVQQVVARQTLLKVKVLSGEGIFRSMREEERGQLAERQQHVIDTLSGVKSMDELPSEQRETVMAELAQIDASVAKAEENRLVCTSEAPLGSRMRKTVCRPLRESNERRDATNGTMLRPRACAGTGCGSD